MGYDFPNNPTGGQTVTGTTGASYRWDGQKWSATGSSGVSSFNTRVGAITLTSADVTTALTYTPYNATNPSGYQTAANVTTAVTAATRNASFANNTGFAINQRGYVSGAALAAGAFGHDRWKAGAGGCTYTFTQSPGPSTTITITAGTLQQVVEGAALAGGGYMLSWTGTAQGRVGAGSYAASPVTVAGVVAGANTTIEFGTGTLGQVRLEAGAVATPFQPRMPQEELAVCQRFYTGMAFTLTGYQLAGYGFQATVSLPVAMRATPTLTPAFSSQTNVTGSYATPASARDVTIGASVSASSAYVLGGSFTASAEL